MQNGASSEDKRSPVHVNICTCPLFVFPGVERARLAALGFGKPHFFQVTVGDVFGDHLARSLEVGFV